MCRVLQQLLCEAFKEPRRSSSYRPAGVRVRVSRQTPQRMSSSWDLFLSGSCDEAFLALHSKNTSQTHVWVTQECSPEVGMFSNSPSKTWAAASLRSLCRNPLRPFWGRRFGPRATAARMGGAFSLLWHSASIHSKLIPKPNGLFSPHDSLANMYFLSLWCNFAGNFTFCTRLLLEVEPLAKDGNKTITTVR